MDDKELDEILEDYVDNLTGSLSDDSAADPKIKAKQRILALHEADKQRAVREASLKQLYFADGVVSSYHLTSEQLEQIRNRIAQLSKEDVSG